MLKQGLRVLLVCLLVAMGAGMAVAQDNMTISGTINDADQLVSEDGQTYDIADTDQGAALLENAGQKVKVTGAVEASGDLKTITVESFEVVQE